MNEEDEIITKGKIVETEHTPSAFAPEKMIPLGNGRYRMDPNSNHRPLTFEAAEGFVCDGSRSKK